MNHEQIESVSGSGGDRQLVLNHGLDMPEDIVVDEASRNLYFTDAIKGKSNNEISFDKTE